MEVITQLIAAAATILAAWVGIKLHKKQEIMEDLQTQVKSVLKELKVAQDRISILSRFCETAVSNEIHFTPVIIMGPRACGKSSLVGLWCKIERLISSISPTPSFDTFDYDLRISTREKREDLEIGVVRPYDTKKMLRFFDYAGEDKMIPSAVKQIADSSKSIILFVLNSDPGLANDNRRYFSRSLVEKLNDALNHSGTKASSIANVYVVFNKIDLISGEKTKNLDDYLSTLRSKFDDSLSNIESIFGSSVKYYVVSARTNHNVLNLLQDIVLSQSQG